MRVVLAALISLVALPAFAENGFAPLPAEQTGGKLTGLELRVVQYQGGVNGVLTIDVRNPKSNPIEFSAGGLYFVPDGNADSAPQRLGAVGGFQEQTQQGWQRREKTTIAANATVRMKLDVFCIDSHRGSPSSSTAFHPAATRLPPALSHEIEADGKKAAAESGGYEAPVAKSKVQSDVWKERNKKWIRLDGEGAQESHK